LAREIYESGVQELTYAEPPSAVIFDMDGVLIDSEPIHAECYIATFQEFGFSYTLDDYRLNVSAGTMNVDQVFQSLGGDMAQWPEVTKAKSLRTKDAVAQKGELRPGVLDLLCELQAQRIPTALATSAGRWTVDILMDQFDLRHFFAECVTWTDVKATKPDPQAFLVAAERLNAKPDECVVIEDSPRGVTAASRAGMRCVAVPTPWTSGADLSLATIQVSSLEDISVASLRELFRRAQRRTT
jgi:beta-phosphoglucomutase